MMDGHLVGRSERLGPSVVARVFAHGPQFANNDWSSLDSFFACGAASTSTAKAHRIVLAVLPRKDVQTSDK
jgi:hypothetical protein